MKLGRSNYLLLPLAIAAAVVMAIWVSYPTLQDPWFRAVLYADVAVCVLFVADFVWRWRGARWRLQFLGWNFFDVAAFIPALVLPDSVRSIGVVILLARLARVVNRIFGDEFVLKVLGGVTEFVVDVIKRPVTIAVLDQVSLVLKDGHYTGNVAAALEENKTQIDEMILELIRNDPTSGKIKLLPFHDELVRLMENTIYRIVLNLLRDQRTNELVSDLVRENIEQIKASIHGEGAEKDYLARQGAGLTRDGDAQSDPRTHKG
ncbi:ion transporter [Skermania sp. ID1734]|uniref:ion transporter n=1 Tax=Skermania sp. ID1734 TaxID=2597516 RepID=UPI00163D919D|nr:ion transporter [Skermania sp. ID1734]